MNSMLAEPMDSKIAKTYRLLMVDDDSTIRDNLKEYLLNYHQADYQLEVEEASTADAAIELLKEHPYDLIITDINLPDQDGFYILQEAAHIQPGIKRALITAYDLDSYIEMAKTEKVYNIIVKTAPFNFPEFSAVVDNLLLPEQAFGLEKYLDNPSLFKQIEIHSSHGIMAAQAELQQFFESHQVPEIDALAVVMVEAITNAVYHSAKLPDGSLRYEKGEVIEALTSEETVSITYGRDDEKLGVSICDKGGTMTADEILFWLERNISGKSLMDTHGRGIYLIHRLTDRVIINLAKNKRTEFILLHYLEGTPHENKPLYINETA